ncbi:MAG: translation initiation factor IF-2 [Chloroflexota bacterium]|nr:translation initiation factor IF-2 [Chloroflexota bacterium]
MTSENDINTESRTQTASARDPKRPANRVLVLPDTISVKQLAELLDESAIDIIKQLMRNGIMVSMNQIIDHQVAAIAANGLGVRTRIDESKESGDSLLNDEAWDSSESLVVRPPVVTILGHVDHGKTSLLDSIREAHVADGEAGGITQHIGAYQILYQGQTATFLDTPGHEAFTAIRSRGARVTDIAILVVAADDGLMPQSIEAINHAKSAAVPIIIAINKMDLPGADPERVKRQLSEQNLLVEDWGGDIISVEVSARTGDGLDSLLESIFLVSEISELKSNPDKSAAGVVIEAELDRRKGPTCTVLVQSGTLRVGDPIVAGSTWGKIRAMTDGQGRMIDKVEPGYPAEVLGFSSVPEAGDLFHIVDNYRVARSTAEDHQRQSRSQSSPARAITLDEIVNQIDLGDIKELNLVLKCDVQGSNEAVRQSLEQLTEQTARVRILHAAVGSVTETDVLLAGASQGIIVGFNVGEEIGVSKVAERMGVEIRHYEIIYKLLEEMSQALQGILEPTYRDIILGQAEVREIFPSRRNIQIAGCRVLEGRMTRGASTRVTRNSEVLIDTSIVSLRHFRDEVNEMNAGTECGIMLQGFNDFQEGDIVESYRQERN